MSRILIVSTRRALTSELKNILKDLQEEYDVKELETTKELIDEDFKDVNLCIIDYHIELTEIIYVLKIITKKHLLLPFPLMLIQQLFDREKIIKSAKLGVRGYVLYPYDKKKFSKKIINMLSKKMLSKYKVTEVLEKDFITLNHEQSIKDALSVLVSNKAAGAVVLAEDKTILGYISEKDLLTCVALLVTQSEKMRVIDIMIKEARTILEFSNFSEALNFLLQNNLRQVPVVNSDDKYLGMVTRSNLLKYILDKGLHI